MTSLESTAENLRASIASRKAVTNPTDDFKAVTAGEETRLREVSDAVAAEATKNSQPAAANE